ncbi:hypothetical protein HG66A1_19120 [Gimesia chilikensis]|uniref:Uncharacterized protein n=2 Tax=Gimesia chilikensis TaxID=2605989 RepID=A0A517PL71_9PLAN|nr:hypothetical protein HG66A1_19120 [Gimesia chilikensis]
MREYIPLIHLMPALQSHQSLISQPLRESVMFNLNITIRCLLLLLVAWPGPRPVVHSHVDYLSQCGNSALLAMHLRIYHGEQSSQPGVPASSHCHWGCSGSDFDKTVPVKLTEGMTVAAAELKDVPGDQLTTDYLGAELCLTTEASLPAARSPWQPASLKQTDLDLQQLFCTWTC